MVLVSEAADMAREAWPEDLDELERALLTAMQELRWPGRRGRPDGPARARLVTDRVAAVGRVRRPARQPPPRPRRPLAAGARGTASTRSVRPATRPTRWSPPPCGRRTRRCCTTARAASTSPGPSRCPAHDGVRDVLLGSARGGRRADRRRAAQGVRARRPRGDPADVDDRLAPAAGDGRGVRHRPRPPARRADALAGRRHRRVPASATRR